MWSSVAAQETKMLRESPLVEDRSRQISEKMTLSDRIEHTYSYEAQLHAVDKRLTLITWVGRK